MLTDTFWNDYFEVYDVLNELYPYQDLLNQFITALNVREGEKILDAGAGTGNLSTKIRSQGGRIYTIDISAAGTRKILEKIPDAQTTVASLCDVLPYNDNTFDAIVSNNVIYSLPEKDRPAVAREFYRVLKPGGRIIVSNVSPQFSPFAIYLDHLKTEYTKHGIVDTIKKIISFIPPTIKMFWYNAKIKKENKGGEYSFLNERDQETFLSMAGFIDIVYLGTPYANQAVMHRAKKPE